MMYKINSEDLLIRLMLIFPCTVLLQGLPGLGWINKAIIAVMMVLLLQRSINYHHDRRIIFICCVLSAASVLLCNSKYLRAQDVFYFPLFVLFLLFWTNNSENFSLVLHKNLSFGLAGCFLWVGLVVVSVIFPSSYEHQELNTSFFRSFSNSPFRLASSCIMIMLFSHVLACYKNKLFFVLEIFTLITILATGARVYLLVGVGIFLASVYLLCRKKYAFFLALIPIAIVLFLAIYNSSIIDKFILVARSKETLYGNYLDAFTSGRTVFWKLDLDAFLSLPFWKQLIGNGLSFPYEVTATQYVHSIWAHNDFVNILMTHGWIGLLIYIYIFIRFALKFKRVYSLNWLSWLLAVGISMGNAFLNGLYFYSAAMLATPLLFYVMALDITKVSPHTEMYNN